MFIIKTVYAAYRATASASTVFQTAVLPRENINQVCALSLVLLHEILLINVVNAVLVYTSLVTDIHFKVK